MSSSNRDYSPAAFVNAARLALRPRPSAAGQAGWVMPVLAEKRDDRDAEQDALAKSEERRFGYEGSHRSFGIAAMLLTAVGTVALLYFVIRAVF